MSAFILFFKKSSTIAAFVFIFILILSTSCNSETYETSPNFKLQFSADTFYFDTVFQSLGSATRAIRIYNPSSNPVIIKSVQLQKGLQSKFRFNINGQPGPIAQNLRIGPKDSLWCFADVTIDPSLGDLIEEDFLEFDINGSKQRLFLRAIGLDVYLHKGEVINANTEWPSDKPHVILDQTIQNTIVPGVYIMPNAKLTLKAGAKLFFSNNAGILVGGSLLSLGTAENPVEMGGLRLEDQFQKLAGQWLGILVMRGSVGNIIENTLIDESIFGLWMGFQDKVDYGAITDANRPQILLRKSTIRNAYYWCIRSFNSLIKAENCVFYTSTDFLVQLRLGGDYDFTHCSLYNAQSKGDKGVLLISNNFYDNQTKTTYKNPMKKSHFTNCILYGTAREQVNISWDDTQNDRQAILFENCLYRSQQGLMGNEFSNCILNQNPSFVSTTIDKEDFRLNANSVCINSGVEKGITTDRLSKPRPVGAAPDMGAYEFQ